MADNYIVKLLEKGSVNISEDVVNRMVNAAVTQVEGVESIGNPATPELPEIFSRKSQVKGIRSRCEDGKVAVDALITVKYGGNITEIAMAVQNAVSREVEAITGMECVVNVHVTGVVFDK